MNNSQDTASSGNTIQLHRVLTSTPRKSGALSPIPMPSPAGRRTMVSQGMCMPWM